MAVRRKTVGTELKKKGDSCLVAKKGKMYIREKNGELSKTHNVKEALAFDTEKELVNFFSAVCVDTRNANVIGKSGSLDIVPITLS